MNILIMAQGQATRFPDKHFAEINGESIIARTLRMVRELAPDATVELVAPNEPRWLDLGVPVWTQEDPGPGLMTGFYNVRNLWSKKDTLVLLGDVVFSRLALETILSTSSRLAFFGRTAASTYTGCRHGEIFGLLVRDDQSNLVLQALSTQESRMFKDGRFWGLCHHVGERADWVEIDDWTDDIDTPEELSSMKRVLSGITSGIITCKGRLLHLRDSVTMLAAALRGPHVVVDYDCPDRSGDWVEQQKLGHVVRVTERPWFHKTHALNLGARRAIELGANWLCFLDSDTQVDRRIGAELARIASHGERSVGFGSPHIHELCGFLFVSRKLFEQVGGYDEGFEGWGYEDIDMRLRLLADAGAEPHIVNPQLLYAIGHSQDLRERFQREPFKVSLKKNRALFHDHMATRKSSAHITEYVERWLGKDIGK